MAEFAEVVFGHIGGLTSYLSWGNVRMFAVTLGVLWAVHIVNQKVGILSLVGGVGERLFGARVEGLKVNGGAVAAEKNWRLPHGWASLRPARRSRQGARLL